MKHNVRIIDTLSYSTFHEVFNSSVVYMCSLIFDKVELRSASSAWQTTQKLISRHNPDFDFNSINHKTIKVIEHDDAVGGLLKYLLSGWLNFWLFLTTPRSMQLVYTNNNPLSLIWVTLFNLVLQKNIVIFCHGELDLLLRNPKISKPSFWYKLNFKLLFSYGFIGKHTQMFVLGESILKNLQPFLNKRNQKQFYSIEHPYFFSECETRQENRPPKIGAVGVMTYAKGLQTLLNLSNKIKITVVGRVIENIDFDEYPNIDFLVKGRDFIPRDQYEKAIEELDYILFLYPIDSYRLIASGAIFDAMDLNKPIITLENDFFKHILKLPIGYVADSETGILEIIKSIPQSKEQYSVFLDNIENLKTHFTPETVADDFQQKLQ